MKRKKLLLTTLMLSTLILNSVLSVSAVSLKDSFSAGTSLTCVNTSIIKGCEWKKTAWAKTVGYKKYHYVRAYIGGSSSSTSGAWADSGRAWSYGDVKASCSCKQWDYNQGTIGLFPIGYGKYGS